MTEYQFSPSELDFQTKCKRCFYVKKKFSIKSDKGPPRVFSSLDSKQKPYYKEINTKDWCEGLPDGSFVTSKELPGKITSEGLVDNKKRKFKLTGNPDIVIRLKDGGYAIYDFKTTNYSAKKAENYKYQLESYAQILSSPGKLSKPTPKLTPIKQMGIIQFSPSEITNHTKKDHNMKFNVAFVELKRNEKDFKNHITNLIDLLENPKIPPFSDDCNSCQFTEVNSNL